jgi:hypothetical protein
LLVIFHLPIRYAVFVYIIPAPAAKAATLLIQTERSSMRRRITGGTAMKLFLQKLFVHLNIISATALAGFLAFQAAPANAAVAMPVPAARSTPQSAALPGAFALSAALPSARAPSAAAPAPFVEAGYYYYHGRRYPYRYHGMYYNHRYYRGGRYHYY